jgi:hypothetical protein
MLDNKIPKRSSERIAKTCRVGPLIVDTITPICQQNGFIQARILLEWDYIVTPQFAKFCIPIKVSFSSKQRQNGKLLLRATSSMATEISYLEPHILNRINQYFGYQAISRINLQQGPVNYRTSKQKRNEKTLSEPTQTILRQQVQCIQDDRLRQALLTLGMRISQEQAEV